MGLPRKLLQELGSWVYRGFDRRDMVHRFTEGVTPGARVYRRSYCRNMVHGLTEGSCLLRD